MLIYTDGACKGNPGVGGWGYLVVDNGTVSRERKGGKPLTTNNEMELRAVYKALRYAQGKTDKVTIVTDSIYVINCLTKWYDNWERTGFLTSSKTPVKNKELIQSIKKIMGTIGSVELKWVKGHSSDKFNARADELANLGVQKCLYQNT